MSTSKMPEQYSLKWNNFHTNLTTGFHGLFEDEDLVDVSLAVEGKIIQAHKVILSVCSPYFKSLFRIHPEKHPIVFLKDVGYSEVIGLLQFMYQGQVDVSQEQLAEFLRVAEMLQVKGLTSNSDSETSNNSITPDIVDPMIPLPVLSTLSTLNNNNLHGTPSNNNNNSLSQNSALKRKKPSLPASSNPLENCEPVFKIVNVESLKKPKLAVVTEDALSTLASTNGISSTADQDASCDSPSSQMVPKIEPVEEYTESNFGDYADIGENFMSHFMEEPASDSSPQQSQQSYSSFTSETQPQQQAVVSKSSTVSPDNSSSGNTGSGTPVQKLTSQQIMNIDVSLLQDPFSRDLSTCETAVVIAKKLFYRGCYYRREKMTYNKKLMWKCINYSKFKCHSRVHTYDGRIIYSSDNHNHRPHALEEDQSVFLTPPAQAKVNHVYRDGHDFIGRTTTPGFETPCSGPEVYANKNTKLSLTKNICYNLQNITKVRANGEGTKDLPSKINDKTSFKTSDETSTKPHDHASAEEIAADSMCSKNTEPIPIDLTHVLSSTIAEIPNSLGKLTKCAVKQELITCTPEIC